MTPSSESYIEFKITTKKCTKCGVDQPLDNFYKRLRHKDKLTHWCKSCFNSSTTGWVAEVSEKRREPSYQGPQTKICSGCLIEKTADNFHKRVSSKDGYKGICKTCISSKIDDPYAVEGTKTCSRCNQEKDRSEFYRTSTCADGLNRWCKDCAKKCSSDWNEKHRGRIRDNGKRWNFSRFGVDSSWYDSTLEEQGGGCAICGAKQPHDGPSGGTKRFSIDHDHTCCGGDRMCGKCRRGLLCVRCNTWIERLETLPWLTRKAIAYLNKYKDPVEPPSSQGTLFEDL